MDLMRTKGISELLGVSTQTVRNWINEGKIPGFKIGGLFFVDADEIRSGLRTADEHVLGTLATAGIALPTPARGPSDGTDPEND